jgi:hypothetical protein
MKAAAAAIAAIALAGCASNAEYFAAIDRANQAAAEVETARFSALAHLAETGDDATRMAAAMALAMSAGAASSIFAPQMPQNQALAWASILVPSLTQLGIAGVGAAVSRTQINANRDVSMATTRGFVDLGTAGIDGAVTIGAAGAAAVERTARAGLQTAQTIALERPEPIVIEPSVRRRSEVTSEARDVTAFLVHQCLAALAGCTALQTVAPYAAPSAESSTAPHRRMRARHCVTPLACRISSGAAATTRGRRSRRPPRCWASSRQRKPSDAAHHRAHRAAGDGCGAGLLPPDQAVDRCGQAVLYDRDRAGGLYL